MPLHRIVYNVVLISCGGYALLRGGQPERIVSLTIILGTALSVLVSSSASYRFKSLELGVFAVDLEVLIIFCAVAVLSLRHWPIWVASLQLVPVLIHLRMMVAPLHVSAYAYGVSIQMWAYPMLFLVAIGTWRHDARLRLGEAERSWKRFSSL